MQITKQFETPKPPLAIGVTVWMSMQEAHSLLWDLERSTMVGPMAEHLRAYFKRIVRE